MNINLIEAIEQIEEEKHIPKEELLQMIEAALLSAYRKNFGNSRNVEIKINRLSGDINIYQLLNVVEEVKEPDIEISIGDAHIIDPNVGVGDIIKKKAEISAFKRIAAQTAKQVLIQRLREIEKQMLFEEYSNFVDKLVTAEIIRITPNRIDVRVGRLETHLLKKSQLPGDSSSRRSRLKVYVQDIIKNTKGPLLIVSRTHPKLVEKLFELEIPEVEEGIVKIMRIAREAGYRSKVAVSSTNPDVDPIGACIGERGSRIFNVMRELNGEKIDLVRYSSDPVKYVSNALSPAKIIEVMILNEENREMRVIVPPNQLSLAIGKQGQNVRLAVKLTGWKIDIKSLEIE